jgi:hypothetical protein
MAVMELTQVQFGTESTFGTAVAGTAKMMGVESVKFTPLYETEFAEDLRGSIAPATLAVLNKVGGELQIDGFLTYEDCGYYLDGVLSQATPTGSNPYTRTYTGPTSTIQTPRIQSIRYGTGSDIYLAEGCVLNELTVSGENNAKLKFSAKYIVQQFTGGASFAALSDRTVTIVNGNHVAVYVDAFGGTVGTTLISNTAYSFTWTINAARVLKHYFGSPIAGAYEGNTYSSTLALDLEMNATSRAYLASIYAATPALYQRLIRITADDTANRRFRLDFAGTLSDGPELFDDRDGVLTAKFNFTATPDPGSFANWLSISNINQVSALP